MWSCFVAEKYKVVIIVKKLISLPEEINDRLKEYKARVGVPVTQYIQEAIYRQMIRDGLIKIKTKEVYITEKQEVVAEPKGSKFCDSEKCELEEIRNRKEKI